MNMVMRQDCSITRVMHYWRVCLCDQCWTRQRKNTQPQLKYPEAIADGNFSIFTLDVEVYLGGHGTHPHSCCDQ